MFIINGNNTSEIRGPTPKMRIKQNNLHSIPWPKTAIHPNEIRVKQ